MDLALLLYLMVISTIAIPALTYSDRRLRRNRSLRNSLITSGVIVSAVAFVAAMNIRLQGPGGGFTAYEFTWFVWLFINCLLTAVFWYTAVIYEDRQRERLKLLQAVRTR